MFGRRRRPPAAVSPLPPLRKAGPPELLPDGRLALPAGEFAIGALDALTLILRALIEHGNAFWDASPEFWAAHGGDDGFVANPGTWRAHLRDPITPEDWAWLQTRFLIPSNVRYGLAGTISDTVNWADIVSGGPPPAESPAG